MSNELEVAFKAGFQKEASKSLRKHAEMDWSDWGALAGGTVGTFGGPVGTMAGTGIGYTVGGVADLAGSLFGGEEESQQSQLQSPGGQFSNQNFQNQMDSLNF